jgi:hypothetical protein
MCTAIGHWLLKERKLVGDYIEFHGRFVLITPTMSI